MTIHTTYVEGPGYLIVEVKGQWEEEDAKQTIEAIHDEAGRRGQTRILLDLLGLMSPRSDLTRYFTGEHVAKHWGYPLRVAALSTREIYTGFAETVAVNRGASIRVFFEKEQALEWLLNESSKTDAGDGG
jgi:hypothetical protein